ncbi:MAG: hypothetical protein SF097_15595 [Acidobacteriota bacterium]|nr:hypothetical protein [Acidobacteriota bacterium]
MQKIFRLSLMMCLLTGAIIAQSTSKPIAKKTTATPASTKTATSTVSPATTELLNLLPASDLLAVVDANRLFNELLPSLAGMQSGGLDKLAKELTEFTQKTGVDPSKINSAVMGLNLKGLQATGAIIISGVDLTAPQIEAAMKEFKAEFKTSDYSGKTIYSLVSKVKAPEAGPLSLNTDHTALAALGSQKFVFGDLSAIKTVIDISTGAAKTGVTPEMIATLNETKASGLLRFALSIPETLKTEAADQGDLFKSVSTIKVVLGALDVAADLSLSLDTLMRTTSPQDATELEDGLKGLVGLVKGIFGGSPGDQKMDALGQLLDMVKISSKLNDVSLSIALPRATLDQLLKKPAPAEKKP